MVSAGREVNIREWTAVTDTDGKFKVQNFDGVTVAITPTLQLAQVIVALVELLDEAQPALLEQLGMSLAVNPDGDSDG